MRKALSTLVAVALAAPLFGSVGTTAAGASPRGGQSAEQRYVVVYQGSADDARAALARLGALVVSENTDVGVATVVTTNANFVAAAAASPALLGAAHDKPIGSVPAAKAAAAGGHVSAVAQERAESRQAGAGSVAAAKPHGHGQQVTPEPLADKQWDMQMIHATADGSYRVNQGDKRVLVGIIDTGIDGNHPDIAPNFNRDLSRNFVTDMPAIDGPCEHPSCVDPVDEDDDGHGTHVSSTIGSPINGLGMAGVAPNVTLVNIRAGQDSGFFFLQETVNAITYAGKAGIDVVNMSFFTDPWLFNCRSNPADTPAEQAEQRTIITATQRAIDFARRHGVTLVAAAGNEQTDIGKPSVDKISPDFPDGAAKTRDIDPADCLTMPTQANGVIVVSALGPEKNLAYFSNYGQGQIDVSAPGGSFRDFFGTPRYRTVDNLVLAAYPEHVGLAVGDIDPVTGDPTNPFVVKDCQNGTCAYYQYLQGTSMASPHAAGVAALIVSRFGHKDKVHGGLTLDPLAVRFWLQLTAAKHACPATNPFVFADPALAGFMPLCEGGKFLNGFYGAGIVDAQRAVGLG